MLMMIACRVEDVIKRKIIDNNADIVQRRRLMMAYIIEGFFFGLMLASLPGPILIAITQTSIEKGVKAGLLVCLGVWISDVIIVSLSYFFIQALSKTIESGSFKFYFGLAGGIMLIIFGIGAFVKTIDLDIQKKKHSYRNMIGFWLKGFLVNTVNPFTFIFWLGVISTYVIGRNASKVDAFIFLSTILITIIVTDTLKVFAAKAIRGKLSKTNIYWFSKISGIGLSIFGLYLIYRVL